MDVTVIYRTADRRRHRARLTTEHRASTYGCPVVVYAGVGLDAAYMTANGMRFVRQDNLGALEALAKAGYPVVR